jgi:hypothetical protein
MVRGPRQSHRLHRPRPQDAAQGGAQDAVGPRRGGDRALDRAGRPIQAALGLYCACDREAEATKWDSRAVNEIDHYIYARLVQEGLSPSSEADRETLINRVALDLTGLPPTLKEVDAS